MKIKPFGYPIPEKALNQFLDPDRARVPIAFEGWTYYRCEWWQFRTTQHVEGAQRADEHPCSEQVQQTFALFSEETRPADRLPIRESEWKPMHDIAPLLNKYPARIFERTHMRHHLQSYPLVRIGPHLAQRGLLQLASQLPGAEILPIPTPHLLVRGKNCQLIIRRLPDHWQTDRPSLSFFQPKQ